MTRGPDARRAAARAAALRAADAAGRSSTHRDSVRLRDAQRAEPLLWILVATVAIAILFLPYAVSQDGPSHVYNGRLFVDWWTARDAFARDWHLRTPALTTNWTGTLLYAALAGLEPTWAEKLGMLVSLLAVAFGWRHFLRAHPVHNAFALPLGVLVAAGAPLFMGFTTYLVGLGLALVAMGEVERWTATWRARHLWVASVVLLLAWLSNPVCWALAAGWIGCVAIVRRDRWRALVVLLPGIALAAQFLASFGGGGREAPLLFLSFGRFAIPSSPFYAMHVAAWMIGTVIAVAVLIHALWLLVSDGEWEEEWRARLLAVGGVMLGVILVPDRAFGAGGSIVMRLQLALFIVAAAVVAWGRPARVSARIAFLHPLLAGGYVVALVLGMVMLQPAIGEHATLPVRAPVVTMRWHERAGVPDLVPRMDVMLHQGARLAARAGVPWLANYETASGFFPLSLRPGVVARVNGGVERAPPCVDLDTEVRYGALVAQEVVTWGFPARTDDPCAAQLLARLSRDFTPVARSRPAGLGVLWRRR